MWQSGTQDVTESVVNFVTGPSRAILTLNIGRTVYYGPSADITPTTAIVLIPGVPTAIVLLAGESLWMFSAAGGGSVPVEFLITDLVESNHAYTIFPAAIYNGEQFSTSLGSTTNVGAFSSAMFILHVASYSGSINLCLDVNDTESGSPKTYCEWNNIWVSGTSGARVIGLCDPYGQQGDYLSEIYVKRVRIPASFVLRVVPSDSTDCQMSVSCQAMV